MSIICHESGKVLRVDELIRMREESMYDDIPAPSSSAIKEMLCCNTEYNEFAHEYRCTTLVYTADQKGKKSEKAIRYLQKKIMEACQVGFLPTHFQTPSYMIAYYVFPQYLQAIREGKIEICTSGKGKMLYFLIDKENQQLVDAVYRSMLDQIDRNLAQQRSVIKISHHAVRQAISRNIIHYREDKVGHDLYEQLQDKLQNQCAPCSLKKKFRIYNQINHPSARRYTYLMDASGAVYVICNRILITVHKNEGRRYQRIQEPNLWTA